MLVMAVRSSYITQYTIFLLDIDEISLSYCDSILQLPCLYKLSIIITKPGKETPYSTSSQYANTEGSKGGGQQCAT